MKLTVFKNQINEATEDGTTSISIQKDFEASMLSDKKMVNMLGDKIHSQGFPEKFSLPCKLSTGVELTLEYEIFDKEINEDKGYHQITISYEFTRDTVIKVRAMLKQAEKDDNDEDGEKYDELSLELRYDIIEVTAEFAEKFTKVYAIAK